MLIIYILWEEGNNMHLMRTIVLAETLCFSQIPSPCVGFLYSTYIRDEVVWTHGKIARWGVYKESTVFESEFDGSSVVKKLPVKWTSTGYPR